MEQAGKQSEAEGSSGGRIVFLAAGGTGGHLFPAEALARVLSGRGYNVHLLTDERVRRFVNTDAGGFAADKVHILPSATVSSQNLPAAAKAVWRMGQGFWQALRLMRHYKPALIIGFGGYPTVAPLLAARLAGVPSVIHEQNAVMGRANRFLARFAARIAVGFPPAKDADNAAFAAKISITGNPLRPNVLAAAAQPYHAARADEPWRLLIFGGSQGASFFAEIMPQALKLLTPALRARLALTQQARPADEKKLQAAYAEMGIKAECAVFFKDLPALMGEAQFVIARAGASTVAEIAAVGRPSLLVPYPNALDNDQRYNARSLAAGGGAEVIEQADLTAEKLAKILTQAMQNPQILAEKAEAAAQAGNKDATEKLADLAERLLG